jgi:acetate---CoA ligase (ADP-forming)
VDLSRLLHPRTIAVVGATDRAGSYAGETLLNLKRLGYPGTVWGVNPGRSEAHGVPCFPSLTELPAPADAVVVAIPAAGVPAAVDEAGAVGCGGAVVYGAGFGEVSHGREFERELADAAARHGLPVCGPNGNGIVALHERAALWGDALRPLDPGHVALVSQSGNVAVNTLATRRGLRLHTVVSCGNAVGLDPAEWILALAEEDSVHSIAVYLEGDGDGELLGEALARCAERGVGVAVLKVGASAAGAVAAAAHTGAVAGDQRVFRALVEEAGAAWAEDVHELLELAKTLGVPGARAAAGAGGLAVLTCSGGDSALAADECERMGLPLPPLAPETAERLRALLPDAATVGNPLDYTALIWGDVELLRDIIAVTGGDPAIDQLLVLYDQPAGIDGSAADASWSDVRKGIHAGAAASPVPVTLASTLPELLDDEAAAQFADAGIPPVAGLRTGLRCAAALRQRPGDAKRLREIASAAAQAAERASQAAAADGERAPHDASRPTAADGWLAEHEAKELLREAALPVVEGRLVASEDDAVAALGELGGALALKLSGAGLLHKSELGGLALDLRSEEDVRGAHRRLVELEVAGTAVLAERMSPAGVELLVSARTDAVVPALVVGLGGIWTETFDDVAIVPLPASPERVEAALLGLRGATLLTGGRRRPPVDLAAVAALASAVGSLVLDRGLQLVELNPVMAHADGSLVVDAIARR